MEENTSQGSRRNKKLAFTIIAAAFAGMLGLLVVANVIAYESTMAMPVVVMVSLIPLLFGVVLSVSIYFNFVSGTSLRNMFASFAFFVGLTYAMAGFTVIGALYFVEEDREYNGQPGDGVVSRGEWDRFIVYQVDRIQSGRGISDDSHMVLCGGFDSIMASLLDEDDALEILTYCVGAPAVNEIDRSTANAGDADSQSAVRPDGPKCTGVSTHGTGDPDVALYALQRQCPDYVRLIDRDIGS